ncbi:MAG: hypothetical protein RLZZ385_2769 [Pseudomonadota bacterium]|jgi:bacterioferritin-associated ferredoxin
MYVCICRQVTDRQIRELCQSSGAGLAEVRATLGVATECGKCGSLARAIVSECRNPAPYENAA